MPALRWILLLTLAAGCAAARPSAWPAAIALDKLDDSPAFLRLRATGPERFSQVDARVYRGGQPTNAQLDDLKALGVTTIISLRDEYPYITNAERKHAEAIGIRFVHVPFSALSPTKPEVIEQVLSTLRDPAAGKVYIHCHIGRDRTGLMVALHLAMNLGWEPARAWQRAALDYGHTPNYWFRALRAAFERTTLRHPVAVHPDPASPPKI